MNKGAARFIVDAIRAFQPQRQQVILDRLQERDGLIALVGDEETAAAKVENAYAFTLNLSNYEDTVEEVREALNSAVIGQCDSCDRVGPLKHWDVSSAGETHQCYFGCE